MGVGTETDDLAAKFAVALEDVDVADGGSASVGLIGLCVDFQSLAFVREVSEDGVHLVGEVFV